LNFRLNPDPFFIQQIAQDLPNLERIIIQKVDDRRINKTVDANVKTLLESLKFFKNLRHFELINDKSEPIMVNPDADSENPEETSMSQEFQLTIKTNLGRKRIRTSRYFEENHAEVIENLKIDLGISEEEEIN
jgi:hypothetical protein